MYGLVQAAWQFYKKLTCLTVTKMGFIKCEANGCLLIRVNDIIIVILCNYVDGMLVVGDKDAFKVFKQEIKQLFDTKEEGWMEEYVVCKVIRKVYNELHMFQPDLMQNLDKKFGIYVCEICKYQTPATPKFSTQRPRSGEVLIPAKMQKRFRIAVGLMLFLIDFLCQDISYSLRGLAKVNN